MRLRNQRFFSLTELNAAIRVLLDRLNDRVTRHLGASRRDLFNQVERSALRPLPAEAYVFCEWKQCTVGLDYHIEVDKHYYSAPHSLLREKVWVRRTAQTVEIFHHGKRVAAHARTSSNRQHTTIADHMPASHRRHSEWSPERLKSWPIKTGAAKIGPNTATLVEVILRDRSHPEQGFRSCLGIMRLAKPHGPESLEAACERALTIGARSYSSVNSILKMEPLERRRQRCSNRWRIRRQLRETMANAASQPARTRRRRARDPARQYPSRRMRASGTTPRLLPLKGKTMLTHPTLDQLRQMKLDGMAEAFIDLQTQDSEPCRAIGPSDNGERRFESRRMAWLARRPRGRQPQYPALPDPHARGKAAPHRGRHRRCRLPDPAQTGPGPVPATRHWTLDR